MIKSEAKWLRFVGDYRPRKPGAGVRESYALNLRTQLIVVVAIQDSIQHIC